LIGRAGSGGGNIIVGGGSGLFQDQVDVVRYSLSDTESRFNIEISLGGTTNDAAAKLKQIELTLDSVRQRG